MENGLNRVKTVGLIIIGDELLKGQVVDTNSSYLCKQLYSLGVKVNRISVISDNVEEIAHEIREYSKKYDFVLTTGGIGPTHDDITYKGLAMAFNDTLAINETMAAKLEGWLGNKKHPRDILLKMAELPSSATLLFEPDGQGFPIIVLKNIYVFPGIPQFLQKLFPRIKPILGGGQFYSRVIYLNSDELGIARYLNSAVDIFKDDVTFGSYPVLNNLYYRTRITMDSQSKEKVNEANQFLNETLPQNSIVEAFDSNPIEDAVSKVYSILEDEKNVLYQPVKTALNVLEDALEKYDKDSLSICFNGGKDCTALLHLVYAVFYKKFGSSEPGKQKKSVSLKTLCIKYKDPYPEMEDFVKEEEIRYNLTMLTYNGPIKIGLENALKEHPEIKGVFMGTRRTDPHANGLDYFQMTDNDWPTVMRISPLLDWTYSNVWQFLRSLSLPYCSLYDKGFPDQIDIYPKIVYYHATSFTYSLNT